MHPEQENKMAFHAIILCNKTPEAKKMINNVSCVSQLLPKIKRSSAPSAARLGRKCGRRRGHRSRVPAGAHAAAAPGTAPPAAGICRMQPGGPEASTEVRPLPGAGREPPQGSASPAPRAAPARASGCSGAPCVLSRLCLEPGAGRSPVLSRKLCVLPVHHYSC